MVARLFPSPQPSPHRMGRGSRARSRGNFFPSPCSLPRRLGNNRRPGERRSSWSAPPRFRIQIAEFPAQPQQIQTHHPVGDTLKPVAPRTCCGRSCVLRAYLAAFLAILAASCWSGAGSCVTCPSNSAGGRPDAKACQNRELSVESGRWVRTPSCTYEQAWMGRSINGSSSGHLTRPAPAQSRARLWASARGKRARPRRHTRGEEEMRGAFTNDATAYRHCSPTHWSIARAGRFTLNHSTELAQTEKTADGPSRQLSKAEVAAHFRGFRSRTPGLPWRR